MIFTADEITDEMDEIFVTPTIGGVIAKINGPLVSGGNVNHTLPSPDGKQVVYTADAEIDEKNELYMVEDVDLVFDPFSTR